MTNDDRQMFRRIVGMCFRATGNRQEPDPDLMTLWFRMLISYDIEDIRGAFAEYMRVSEFQPTPAAIIRILDSKNPSGWPTPDEAWAIALQAQDEAETVIMCDEIAQAMAVAAPVLEAGDKYGARNAFVAAYGRMVDTSRRVRPTPQWWPSYGHSVERRQDAIEHAVQEGRLPASHMIGHDPLSISGPVMTDEKRRENLARVRATLATLCRSREPDPEIILADDDPDDPMLPPRDRYIDRMARDLQDTTWAERIPCELKR